MKDTNIILDEIYFANAFRQLLEKDVSGKIEKKRNGQVELSYLSWAYAWAEFSLMFPTATYEIKHWEGLPFLKTPEGYLVETCINVNGLIRNMWLPVMDSANKAMKEEAYKYKTKSGDKEVQACSMFDINKTLMRCLVKNIAMFGLGLSIFAGEDIPDNITDEVGHELNEEIINKINNCKTVEELTNIYKEVKEPRILKNLLVLCTAKKKELEEINKNKGVKVENEEK